MAQGQAARFGAIDDGALAVPIPKHARAELLAYLSDSWQYAVTAPPDLAAAVPALASWKLAALPRYLAADKIERLVVACTPNSAAGARDRAVVLLCARLGLRAGDVRDLRLGDVDWSRGRLRVMGKGRCQTWPSRSLVGLSKGLQLDQHGDKLLSPLPNAR